MASFSNWIMPLTGDRKIFQPPAASHMTVSQYDGRFSSDGRWLAYFSYETGRPEIYVVPFGAGAKTQVSTTGGWNTLFGRNNELFFVSMGNRLDGRAHCDATQFPRRLHRAFIPTRSAKLYWNQLRRKPRRQTVCSANHRPHQIHLHHFADKLARGTQEVARHQGCRIKAGNISTERITDKPGNCPGPEVGFREVCRWRALRFHPRDRRAGNYPLLNRCLRRPSERPGRLPGECRRGRCASSFFAFLLFSRSLRLREISPP